MNKTAVSVLCALAFALCMAALLLQGFALPALPATLALVLRIAAGFSAQAFAALNFRHPVMQVLPLLVTALIGVWGGCLFVMAADWENAALNGYLSDYCTPVVGAIAAVGLFGREQQRHL